ncbi:alpha/beta fold hydrolase [Nocardia sp. NPDC047648]|uniref:alpha/beta hydrolase n=1 Tax=Nocardia sp. NPDC047648 TaxID=3155625 RepID=UPI0034080011
MTSAPRYYRDQPDWRALQAFLPERLRLDAAREPAEEFWEWGAHRIHLDTYRNPRATAKVILHHGVGTNGRQMTLILGSRLARRGFEVIAPDNLGYGMTAVAPGTIPTYDDWVALVVDLVAAERAHDDRPVVLYGLSAGGMLTYHVAAEAPKGDVSGIAGMTFLDQRIRRVRDETAHDVLTARVGMPLISAVAGTAAGGLRVPMRLASKMRTLANDREAMRSVLLKDRTAAANWVSARFLDSYARYTPAVEYEDFQACPILLTQPAADRWTPLHLSEAVLSRITRVPVRTVLLDNAGHLPMEDPGLRQMEDAVVEFVLDHTAA